MSKVTGEELLDHIRDVHGTPLEQSDLFEHLEDLAAFVHAAMHNGRAYVGHFQTDDEVLGLWDASGRIQQVETHGKI